MLLPAACSQVDDAPVSGTNATFLHGVASGDPDSTSVVIWTRISNATGTTGVGWRVASDVDFQNVVANGQYSPGQDYFYQFVVDGRPSPTGRTKTLPIGHVDRMVFAVATCSNYAFGYFNAYEAIAKDEDIDLVVHLGDYIYEHGRDAYAGETGRRIGRNHEPPHEALTLVDYRQRFAQYKTDEGSKDMHARHPLIVIWDDHETANNPWMGGADNHQADEGDWESRRSAALQAFYEWLPVRDPQEGGAREEYWRHYKFGDLASLITLEGRHTGRSKQVSIDEHLPGIDTRSDAEDFINNVIGAPGRSLLSAEMEQFLSAELAESVSADRRWRIIGNQSVMARRIAPRLDDPFFEELKNELDGDATNMLNELTKNGEFELPVDLDSWNGYPEARESFYRISKDVGARDLLVLAGDSHSFWQNALYDIAGESMGVELGSTGITSPRSLLDLGQEGLEFFDKLNAENNREVVWTDGRYRGFIRLEVNHDRAHADFVRVTNVESRDYDVEVIRSVDIESSGGTLQYV
jgi:alkaline phosphatase D